MQVKKWKSLYSAPLSQGLETQIRTWLQISTKHNTIPFIIKNSSNNNPYIIILEWQPSFIVLLFCFVLIEWRILPFFSPVFREYYYCLRLDTGKANNN